MQITADFHLHSKYSRATSKDLDLDHLALWAKKKGIKLLGTGDFTHPLWLKELKTKLQAVDGNLFEYKGVHFVLTTELSNIYSKNGKTYRIHTVYLAPGFETVDLIVKALLARGANLSSDGRPILGMDVEDMSRMFLDLDENIFIIPAHIWTPWFAMFGSKSGFNSIEECWGKLARKITCVETGLSSDPAMNWRLSALDRMTLVSNSDAHSPSKIGRECNVFDCEMSFQSIVDTLQKKGKGKLLYTVEFFPEEGKYHYDGHRACQVSFGPEESKKYNDLCPTCNKPLVLGVMHRINELADRPPGFKPEGAVDYINRIPLEEIIADAHGVGVHSRLVQKDYEAVIQIFGNEFDVLSHIGYEYLTKSVSARIVEGIQRVREGQVNIIPGYDGEYGKISIFSAKKSTPQPEQLTLFT